MTTETQDTATATNDGGGTQTTDTTTKVADTSAPATTTTAAPAEVEYKFDAPEGVELNQEDLGKFTAIAKELKLPADAAKKFVDLAPAREVARAEAFAKQVETWGEQVKADKELGTAENLATAKKAIDTFGTPELRDLLNTTGMGNHPEVIRLALAVGRAISEDKIVAGRSGGETPPRSHADILYGNTPKT
jgi:hypothetical protein